MAEARVGDEEESLRESRDSGGGGARRNPRSSGGASAERADRNKPEQRLSTQGPLSSIRAVIKRTTTRTAPTDQTRERRRPQITIVAAEPLASNAWFPPPSGAFPAAPPPPAQPSWTGALTVQLPPPSYEQVIREKSRELSTPTPTSSTSVPPSTPSSSSSSPSALHLTSTIATQTDTEVLEPPSLTRPSMRRPPKPPRPSPPPSLKPTEASLAHGTLIELDEPDPPCAISTQTCPADIDFLGESLPGQFRTQTDFSDEPKPLKTLAPTLVDSSEVVQRPPLQCPVKQEVSQRPRPRPRSKAFLQPIARPEDQDQQITRDVKVQTLVRLKDDPPQSVFASFTDSCLDMKSNKYLQDLMDVFGCDKQELQDDQQGKSDQSDKSEEEEDAISESRQVSLIGSEPLEPLTRPEPRPRTQNPKPLIPPKPSDQSLPVQKNDFSKGSTRTQSPPVPVPRILHKTTSVSQQEGSKPEPIRLPPPPRPPTAVRRSGTPTELEGASHGHQASTVPSVFPDKKNSDHHDKASSSYVPAKPPSTTSSNRVGHKCPALLPSQRRPPFPNRTPAQDDNVAVSMGETSASSVPSLPPRPSEGRMFPLRPPPAKTTKSAGSPHPPHAPTNQGSRVPKRGPPLPPRPTPGHPLYRDNMSKVSQGISKAGNPSNKPEEPNRQKEELLLAFDLPEEKGESQQVPTSTPEELKKEQQQTRFLTRFAFEGEEGELTLCEGDVILLIEYLNPEWARGSLNGQTGNFPLNFVQEIHEEPEEFKVDSSVALVHAGDGRTGRAMYDFSPESEDELCLKVGDVVCYLEEVDDEWFVGEFAGRRGIVPKNFIQVL